MSISLQCFSGVGRPSLKIELFGVDLQPSRPDFGFGCLWLKRWGCTDGPRIRLKSMGEVVPQQGGYLLRS